MYLHSCYCNFSLHVEKHCRFWSTCDVHDPMYMPTMWENLRFLLSGGSSAPFSCKIKMAKNRLLIHCIVSLRRFPVLSSKFSASFGLLHFIPLQNNTSVIPFPAACSLCAASFQNVPRHIVSLSCSGSALTPCVHQVLFLLNGSSLT